MSSKRPPAVGPRSSMVDAVRRARKLPALEPDEGKRKREGFARRFKQIVDRNHERPPVPPSSEPSIYQDRDQEEEDR